MGSEMCIRDSSLSEAYTGLVLTRYQNSAYYLALLVRYCNQAAFVGAFGQLIRNSLHDHHGAAFGRQLCTKHMRVRFLSSILSAPLTIRREHDWLSATDACRTRLGR